jgi:hypothetical protein
VPSASICQEQAKEQVEQSDEEAEIELEEEQPAQELVPIDLPPNVTPKMSRRIELSEQCVNWKARPLSIDRLPRRHSYNLRTSSLPDVSKL